MVIKAEYPGKLLGGKCPTPPADIPAAKARIEHLIHRIVPLDGTRSARGVDHLPASLFSLQGVYSITVRFSLYSVDHPPQSWRNQHALTGYIKPIHLNYTSVSSSSEFAAILQQEA